MCYEDLLLGKMFDKNPFFLSCSNGINMVSLIDCIIIDSPTENTLLWTGVTENVQIVMVLTGQSNGNYVMKRLLIGRSASTVETLNNWHVATRNFVLYCQAKRAYLVIS